MLRHARADVARIPLADAAACAGWWGELQAARGAWTERGNGLYTLGAAAYLDLCPRQTVERYQDRARSANPALRERFGDLLCRVRDAVAGLLGARCELADDAIALPGFHVFTPLALRGSYRDALHLDLQHQYLPVGDGDLAAPTLTFTLPIELPAVGGGIEFCEAVDGDKRGRLRVERYAIGELFVHSGRVLHRRAHLPTTGPQARVTLQGHALYLERRWILYW